MASNYLTTGIKINVDATDFDTKFAKMAEELNRTLTKSQKSLGLQYDANQRLVNSQGQVVEGLSQAQIKLGYYVDELGRTRTYQGGFTEGLNASQKAMGWDPMKPAPPVTMKRFAAIVVTPRQLP